MTTERVYSPDTCEPFDVPASKAVELRLEKGWTSTPWRREPTPQPIPVEVIEAVEPERDTGRGRGRRRHAAPAEVIDLTIPAETEADEGE